MMSFKIGLFVFLILFLVSLFSFFAIFQNVLSLNGIIIEKEIIQSQYITNIQGPPLYVEQSYQLIIDNGWYKRSVLVDENVYNELQIGDYYLGA